MPFNYGEIGLKHTDNAWSEIDCKVLDACKLGIEVEVKTFICRVLPNKIFTSEADQSVRAGP